MYKSQWQYFSIIYISNHYSIIYLQHYFYQLYAEQCHYYLLSHFKTFIIIIAQGDERRTFTSQSVLSTITQLQNALCHHINTLTLHHHLF